MCLCLLVVFLGCLLFVCFTVVFVLGIVIVAAASGFPWFLLLW